MRTYIVTLEVDDESESDGEDIQEILEDFISGQIVELPEDLSVRVIDIEEE